MKHDKIFNENCVDFLLRHSEKDMQIDLSFLDPPFNQGKEYRAVKDDLPDEEYWKFMKRVSKLIYNRTKNGGSIYFMQRDKNTKKVIETLEETGWKFQNLIIWKKKSAAVPQQYRFGLSYQIIVFATKGNRPSVFNRLRINPPRLITEKYERPTGMYITDVWDDIRELTSGYFAGDEAIRTESGERFHKQQSPVALLLRIILSSTNPGDLVFDPFAGTGTTLVVAKQLMRKYLGTELDPVNYKLITKRLSENRETDSVSKCYKDYIYTENLDEIFPTGNQKTLKNTIFLQNEKND